MFSVTHFRSEFIQQTQATILRRVTMTQFMLVIVFLAIGLGLFKAPFWLAPPCMVAGYAAGYMHRGEIVLKRLAAYAAVWARSLARAPRVVNVHAEWEQVRMQAERGRIGESFSPVVVINE
ncbi:MAG: hypothetical protein ACRDHL_06900 [Candidatus Promineifilaceae bacterium]